MGWPEIAVLMLLCLPTNDANRLLVCTSLSRLLVQIAPATTFDWREYIHSHTAPSNRQQQHKAASQVNGPIELTERRPHREREQDQWTRRRGQWLHYCISHLAIDLWLCSSFVCVHLFVFVCMCLALLWSNFISSQNTAKHRPTLASLLH